MRTTEGKPGSVPMANAAVAPASVPSTGTLPAAARSGLRRLIGTDSSRFAPLTAVGSAGLLSASAGFWLSRSDPTSGRAQALFWAGLGLIVLPVAVRLVSRTAVRAERVGLLLVVGVLLYAVKVLHDPFGFTYADEWVHVYNADQILRTGSLFHANPIIDVTSRYPGLESLTAAVASLTHLSVFASGVIVLGVARIVCILALFLALERMGGSSRVASIAVLVYTTNPNFLFWSAEFSYESLALPLALLAVFAVVRSRRARPANAAIGSNAPTGFRGVLGRASRERLGWSAVACTAIAATVVTHHLTSYALCSFLVLTSVVASLRRSTRRDAPWVVAGFAVAATVTWVVTVAPGTGHYLLPVLGRAFHQTVATVLGHSTGRSLFGGGSGGQPGAPLWQRLVALASVGLVVVALPFGLLGVNRRFRRNPFVIVLAAAALAYVAVLPMRLIPAAWETSNRSSEFLYVGVALVLALVRLPRRVGRPLLAVGTTASIGVLLVGGLVAGWPPRVLLALPARAQASGGAEIAPQPDGVARWARTVLGTGHRFIAPEAVGRELLVNGGQTVFVTSAPFKAATVLFGDSITSGIVDSLASHSIGFVAEDRLASGDDSMAGYFFRAPDPARPVDPLALEKFDGFPGVDRVLDSGDIAVYDVRRLGAP
jgi:hypothetical protein